MQSVFGYMCHLVIFPQFLQNCFLDFSYTWYVSLLLPQSDIYLMVTLKSKGKLDSVDFMITAVRACNFKSILHISYLVCRGTLVPGKCQIQGNLKVTYKTLL